MIFDINKNEIKNMMGIEEETDTRSNEQINLEFSKKMFEMCSSLYNNSGVTIVKHDDNTLSLFMIPPYIVNDNYNGVVADYGHKIINLFNMIIAHLTNMEYLEPLYEEACNISDDIQEQMKFIAQTMYRIISEYEKKDGVMISDYLLFIMDLNTTIGISNVNRWCDAVTFKIDKYFKEVIEENNFNIIKDFNNWKKTSCNKLENSFEPFEPEEEITAFLSPSSVLKRMMDNMVDEGLITDPNLSEEELDDLKNKVVNTMLKGDK